MENVMKNFITLMKAAIIGMGIAIFVMGLAANSASAYQAAPQSSDRAKEMMAKNAAKKAAKNQDKQLKKMGKAGNGTTVVVVEKDKDLVEKLEDAVVDVIVDETIRKRRRIN
jgi:hypothetical protein